MKEAETPVSPPSPDKAALIAQLDAAAPERGRWKRKNRYYHSHIEAFCRFLIPEERRVLEIGCGIGDLLSSVKPSLGVGVDFSAEHIKIARTRYPGYTFHVQDAETLELDEKFDYVILSDLVGYLFDTWQAFRSLRRVTHTGTRVIITYFNSLWEPLLDAAQALGIKTPQNRQNWLSLDDIENLLDLNGYEVIRRGYRLLIPVYIPLVSFLANNFLAKLPGLRKLCLMEYVVARERGRPAAEGGDGHSCSVVIPCRNEVGNIQGAVERTPAMGSRTELIFVDGNSTDGTVEAVQEQIENYRGRKDIKLIHQGDGRGKADAVRKGFEAATGEFLFILDSDLTVPPEDLPKFYRGLTENQGELINGTRLVYPMQDEAMRPLNILGNKGFSMIFTWLLDQRIKDTLCGTKVLTRENYEKIRAGRAYFGEFDPFGDFDLIFGAAKQNFKIVEIPVRYRARVYGDTKISRFRHGWLLLMMCFVALRKLKLK